MRGFVKQISTLSIALMLMAAACRGGGDEAPAMPSATGAQTAVAAPSTSAAESPAPTATAGAAEAPAPAPAPGAYRVAPAVPAARFGRMVGLFPFPDDPSHAALLTQHAGVIYRVSMTSGDAPSVFLDLSGLLIDGPRNEEGLLGFAFAPDYASSGRFFVSYTAGRPRRSVIARYEARGGGDASSGRVILEVPQPYANHNGGALAFGPDGHLYIALGDGGDGGDPHGHGQDTSTLLGSILRIDVSGEGYAVPPDNPFAGGGGAPEIWAYGFRNPWRMSFDRETGALWTGDVGQGAWEEVDRVVRGGNYGWNIVEGPACFRASDCDRTGLTAPRAWYRNPDDGCSVTGGFVYRGAAMPELRGWYVYGDYCSGRVWALDTRDDAGEPLLLLESGAAITSFAEDAAGELYLITFDAGVLRLERE